VLMAAMHKPRPWRRGSSVQRHGHGDGAIYLRVLLDTERPLPLFDWAVRRGYMSEEYSTELPERPRTRAECIDVPRPCPWVGCRHNLFLDVSGKGGLKLNFPGIEPGDMPAARSCSLDVAEERARTLPELGDLMNLGDERVRQILDDTREKLHDRIETGTLMGSGSEPGGTPLSHSGGRLAFKSTPGKSR